MKIVDIWLNELLYKYRDKAFRLYLTCDDDVILKFHQVHPGEEPWLNEDDWKKEIVSGKIKIWTVGGQQTDSI